MTDPKRVSMYDAERKSLKKAKIIMGLVTVLLICLSYLNLFHTNLYMWQMKADNSARLLGALIYGLCFIPLIFESWISNAAKSETIWYIIWIALLLAAIATSCGFNFSL